MKRVGRSTIDFGEDIYEKIEYLAQKQHCSKNEVVRKAVVAYKYLVSSLAGGQKVSISDEAGKIIMEVIIL